MSLILKGIDMPKDCDDCMFNFYREGDSCPACYLTKHIVIRKKEENIPTDCPLVEIPSPHGRLIDADALFQDLREHNIPFNNDINSAINVAPTILEEEE